MKDVILSILLALMVGALGGVFAELISGAFGFVGGLVMFLCIEVVICTYMIIKKIDKK